MSEEEKKAIETLKIYIEEFKNQPIMYNYKLSFDEKEVEKVLTTLLNLIEKQQKTIKELMSICDLYKGASDHCVEIFSDTIKPNFISKDKIREKLDYQYMLWNTPNRQKEYNQEVVDILEELLEENNAK